MLLQNSHSELAERVCAVFVCAWMFMCIGYMCYTGFTSKTCPTIAFLKDLHNSDGTTSFIFPPRNVFHLTTLYSVENTWHRSYWLVFAVKCGHLLKYLQSILCSQNLNVFDQKCSKGSTIVKCYYNLK